MRSIKIGMFMLAGVALDALSCQPRSCAPWDMSASGRIVAVQGSSDKFDEPLDWTLDGKLRQSLVATKSGYRVVASKVWFADDGMLGVYRHSSPGPGWAIGLPGERLVAGNVDSAPAIADERIHSDADYALTLQARDLPAVGIAQRCERSGKDGIWCSLVASSRGSRQLLYSAPVRTVNRDRTGTTSTGFALQYAGDLNRDGVLDLLFQASWSGGAFCGGDMLYLSRRTGETFDWVLSATDVSCD